MSSKNSDPRSIEEITQLLLVLTGKALVCLISLGAWRTESMAGREPVQYTFDGALSFIREGRRVVTVAGQELIGIAFYSLLFGVLMVLMLSG